MQVGADVFLTGGLLFKWLKLSSSEGYNEMLMRKKQTLIARKTVHQKIHKNYSRCIFDPAIHRALDHAKRAIR